MAESLVKVSEYPHHILKHHIEEASEFLKTLSIRKIWIKDVKEFLDNKFPDNPLSATAVHYLMKKILGYSYKKAHKIPRKMMSKDRLRDFIEAAYLQVYLEKEGYRLVYLDEFHLSMKSRAIYNWSLKGTPAWWAIDPDPWTMSFIVSFSYKRVEGILASNISIKSFSYKNFVSAIWKRQIETDEDKSDKVCIVFDNASFHVNEAAICCYRELEARWISIPPYSPQLNPTEKLIAKIKAEIWKQWTKNKALNLNMIKKIVNSIAQRDCSSRKEWMMKLLRFELFV